MDDTAAFLRAQPPFDTLDDAALSALAEVAKPVSHEAGSVVLARAPSPPAYALVVRDGSVELGVDGRVFDLLGPGEMLGYAAMLAEPVGFTARAAEPTTLLQIPKPAPGRAALRRAHAGRAARAAHRPRSRGRRRPGRTPGARADPCRAGGLRAVDHGPGGGAPDGRGGPPERRRAGRRRPRDRHRPRPAHARAGRGRGRVDAAVGGHERPGAHGGRRPLGHRGDDGDARPRRPPPARARRARAAARRRRRHRPDRLRAPGPVPPAGAIARAATAAEVAVAARELPATVIALHDARVAPATLARTIASIRDTAARRLIELAERELGRPPVAYSWLALGSFGRREPFPGPDADSALAWDGPDDEGLQGTMLALRARDRRPLGRGHPPVPGRRACVQPAVRGRSPPGSAPRGNGWPSRTATGG